MIGLHKFHVELVWVFIGFVVPCITVMVFIVTDVLIHGIDVVQDVHARPFFPEPPGRLV